MTGLQYDEGPDIGGEYGPYVQSERMGLYMDYAKELVEKGEAYYCFCTKERLESLKEANAEGVSFAKYDRHCLHLSPEEVQAKLAAGEPLRYSPEKCPKAAQPPSMTWFMVISPWIMRSWMTRF